MKTVALDKIADLPAIDCVKIDIQGGEKIVFENARRVMANAVAVIVEVRWMQLYEGEPMTVTAQFLDSVNVPPPGLAAEIWAPVGLRYHALHHLMPSMPYHDLPEAHRRLARELGTGSTYEGANHPGMLVLVGRIAKSTMGKRAA